MIAVSFRFESQKAKQVVSQVMMNKTLRACSRLLRLKRASLHVSVVGDATMRRMNRIYRSVNATTDVLSFAAGEGVELPAYDAGELGDIFLNWQDVLRRRTNRIDGFRRAAFLAVHGMLHCAGFDHHTANDQRRMRRYERAACGAHTYYEETV